MCIRDRYIIALGGKVSMTMAVFFIIGVMFIGLGKMCIRDRSMWFNSKKREEPYQVLTSS